MPCPPQVLVFDLACDIDHHVFDSDDDREDSILRCVVRDFGSFARARRAVSASGFAINVWGALAGENGSAATVNPHGLALSTTPKRRSKHACMVLGQLLGHCDCA